MLKDLGKKKDSELQELLAERREDLRKLRFEKISGAMKNPHEVQDLKRDIARLLTEMRVRR